MSYRYQVLVEGERTVRPCVRFASQPRLLGDQMVLLQTRVVAISELNQVFHGKTLVIGWAEERAGALKLEPVVLCVGIDTTIPI